MVRIIPSRLKPSGTPTANSVANSRSASPLRNKMDLVGVEGPMDTGLALNVVILKARDLAAKDRGGTSDPYLVLTLGDAKHVTHSVPKTLNPDWNETCRLPINGIPSLILDVCCWDKDRFGKDYLGEFDLALEEIFVNERTEQEPRWFPLNSKRPGKKTSVVSGQVLLQFTLMDVAERGLSEQQVLEKFNNFVKIASEAELSLPSKKALTSSKSMPKPSVTAAPTLSLGRFPTENDEDEEDAYDDEITLEDEDLSKPDLAEKRKRRLRIKGLKRKRRDNPYEFINPSGDVVGIVFLEIKNIADLPPESNFTKTSFDMDPFVVTSLGRKTFRTKKIHHNLNPVFNEKMIFQVMGQEQSYSFSFTVIDHDKYSGNDFIASTSLPIKDFIDRAPKADPETGLYELGDLPEYLPVSQRGRFRRLGLSRSPSAQSLSKVGKGTSTKTGPGSLQPAVNAISTSTGTSRTDLDSPVPATYSAGDVPALLGQAGTTSVSGHLSSTSLDVGPDDHGLPTTPAGATASMEAADSLELSTTPLVAAAGDLVLDDEQEFNTFTLPLKMKNLEKWEDKHNPRLTIRAKYMPYSALRQQFWRAMLRQYDTDESGRISKVELSTMLDTLGSTLRESTIDSFFQRFPKKASGSGGVDDDICDLTIDEAVICLEDQLDAKPKLRRTSPASSGDRMPGLLSVPSKLASAVDDAPASLISVRSAPPSETSEAPSACACATSVLEMSTVGDEADFIGRDDLNDRGEEHVVEIRECPICHQPRLNKRKDTDIITHIATCASQDWRQVNNLVMGGFVTASQAQRKWYSKIITKISYGGYRIGANSANILVQDRITGQIIEEKMSVYVRLGIRLLYKGLRSNNMENKRIRKMLKGLSIKQGKKYDDPASKSEIQKFVDFHQLDMSEVLLPVDEFKNFNEFFYRALKPGARPASAPNNTNIIVSPADCRSVVFNRIDVATKIWIKGREFSVRRLLGASTAEDVSRYENGALGIFRLAPQDYHRFHIPVDGVLGRPTLIAGEYYTVNPMAIRSALDVYGENVRVVVPIESEAFGRVMVVCVGAMMVGSTVITRQDGDNVKRAEELGYFKFGGSTIVLLFEEGRMRFDDDLVENSNVALETLIRAGMSVGHSPSEPQWKADMPKDENEVTEQEKQEAKRRIQGRSSAEDTPDDSGGDEMPFVS